MLTHIVLIRLHDKSQESVARVRDLLCGLEGNVPQVEQIEVGADVVHSERSYDLALIARFDSLADMQDYAVHPFHQGVLKEISNAVSSTVTVDFES